MPAPQRALQLFGVTPVDIASPTPPARGVEVVSFRDLGALVCESPYAAPAPTAQQVAVYRRVIEGVFARQTIVPAPFGTVFRARESLMRWLELHYFTLLEAVTFVADRAMARVTVSYADEPEDTTTMAVDADLIESAADESFRLLRRHAVASLTLNQHGSEAGPTARASFLVENDRWTVFSDIVREEQRRLREMRVECTGPWPPYDFVRMQFGA